MASALSDFQPQPAPQATAAAQAAIGDGLVAEAQAFADELAAWRHDLHQMPELGNNLPQTSAYIQARLDEMDIPHTTLVDGSCVVGLIGAGAAAQGNGTCKDEQAGTVVMLRGDMDALPVVEESGEPFASTNGCMHACGHDMHATALLGAARLLKAREAELVEANATVKLLFQPGEETFEGARAAIADGLLENPRPQAAFAMHVNSQSPLGLVLYGSPALSGVYGFRITLQGKGGHGSSPEICIDPITAGVHVHLALQELISREVPAAKEVALTVGKFAGGLAANVIPDTCVLEGTLRGFDVELMAHLKTRIAEVVNGVATTYRTPATIETLSDVPPLVLDSDMTQASLGYVGAVLPKAAFLPLFHAMASEDFALISSEIPSAYFTVGAAVTDTDERFAQHHPKARFNDAELPLGAAAYTAVALGYIADHRMPQQRKFFPGWLVVASGFVIMATCYTIFVNCMSMFQPLIVSDLGISLAQYNISNAISTVVSVVGSLVIGHVADKVSGRVLGSLTVIATSAVLAGMSFVGELWQVYVLFAVSGSFASTWIVCLACSVVMLVFLLASEPIAAKLRACVAGE